MKGKGTLFITNLVMLALGGVLIAFFNNANMAELIATALGVLFLAPSLFSLIMLLFTNVSETDAMYNPRYNLIPVIGGLSFGLVMVLQAASFVPMLKYLFGILLVAGGLYYVFYLLFVRARVVMPRWYFFLPSMVTLVGVVVLLLSVENHAVIFLSSGVSLVALAVTSIVIAYSERKASKKSVSENGVENQQEDVSNQE